MTSCSGRSPPGTRPTSSAGSRMAPINSIGGRPTGRRRPAPARRAAARQQRRHAGVPLVGEGAQRPDRHQPPQGCRRDRAPPLRRPRAPPRRRGEPRQHPLRRCRPLDADDEHGPDPAATDRARLRRLLRPPLRDLQDPQRSGRRVHAGALGGDAAEAQRRAATDPPRPQVRPRPRLGHGHPARPPGGGRRRRPARRPPGRLHDLPRLRRGRPPFGDRASGHAGGAREGRPPDRPHREGHRRGAAAVPADRARRSRSVAGRHVPAALRLQPPGARREGLQLVRAPTPPAATRPRRAPTSVPG